MCHTSRILWTGGWDSTYRVIDLLRKGFNVEPYYVDNGSRKVSYEIDTMLSIRKSLNEKYGENRILDIKIIKLEDVPKVESVVQSFQQLKKKEHIGGQYRWLACFSQKIKGLEICIEMNDGGCQLLKKYGKIISNERNNSDVYFTLDSYGSNIDLYNVFGKFRYPLLETTKVQMSKNIQDNGDEFEIMNRTWFCHYPINGQPCGFCTPCALVMKGGLNRRISLGGKSRYQVRKLFEQFGVIHVIRRKSIRKFKDIILRAK